MSQNHHDPRQAWARLTSAARTVRDDRDDSAPYGFATRVVALARAQERRVVSLLERFALRAVGVASLLALCGVALNYSAIIAAGGGGQADEDLLHPDDAVSIVLDLSAQD